MKRIYVKYGEVRAIAKLCGVSPKTVYNALIYKYENCQQSYKIRRIAKARGGFVIEDKQN